MAPCDPRDIGRVAARVAADHALQTATHASRCYDISGPELMTFTQALETIARACGRPFEHEPVLAEALEPFLPPYLHQLLLYMEQEGKHAIPFSTDVLDVTGTPATSLKQWLRCPDAKPLFQ